MLGSMGHEGLHSLYRNTEHPIKAFLDYGQDNGVTLTAEDQDFWNTLFNGYINHYEERDRHLEVLEIEKPLEVEILPNVFILMTIDMLVREGHRIWVWDHKFYGKRASQDKLLMDPQMSAYIWALRRAGIKVSGAVYNVIIKRIPNKPEVLKSGKLSQAKNQGTDYTTYLNAIHENNLNPEDYSDFLSMLKAQEEDSPFFQRILVARSPIEDHNFETSLKRKVQDIIDCDRNPDNYYTNEADHCDYCEYLPLCKARLEGADLSCILPMYQQKLEGQR